LQRFVTNMLDDLSAPRTADLSLELSPTPGSRKGTVKVAAVISNDGPEPVRRASLAFSLPARVRLNRVASTGLSCTRLPLRCTIADLPGESRVEGVFTLRTTTHQPARITAEVSAPTVPDPSTAATAQLTISPDHVPAARRPVHQAAEHSNSTTP
jgi:hypothetical protein